MKGEINFFLQNSIFPAEHWKILLAMPSKFHFDQHSEDLRAGIWFFYLL